MSDRGRRSRSRYRAWKSRSRWAVRRTYRARSLTTLARSLSTCESILWMNVRSRSEKSIPISCVEEQIQMGCPSNVPGEIVDDFGPLLIDLRIDLMDECPIAVGEVDPDIVRGRADPDGLAVERTGAAKDSQMMALREGVVAFLISHVGRLAIQQQYRHRPFLVSTRFDQRAGRLQFRLRVQARRRGPAGLLEQIGRA